MTFWGFTDRFSPKEKALAERRLSAIGKCTTVLFEGKEISPPEYIRQLVKRGGDLMCEPIDSRRKEFKIYVNAEVPYLDGTREYVSAKDKKVFTSLTKTQYNFAVYLRLNHFDDDDVAREFERKEQEDSLKREKEQDEAIHEEEARKKRFDKKLKEKTSEILKETPELGRAAYNVYNYKTGFCRGVPYEILGAIALMPDPFAKDFLRSVLHPANVGSRAIFELVTGVSLPTGARDLRKFIDKLSMLSLRTPSEAEIEAVKPRGEEYYICTTSTFEKAWGVRVDNPWGFDFFATKRGTRWVITEGKTGLLVATCEKKSELSSSVEELIQKVGMKAFCDKVESHVKRNGLSPLYRKENSHA